MYTETEGIILKQTKIVGGRRMVLLFSKKFGKISAGSSINEKGKGKSALAMRPFTHGRYELFKKNDFFNINGAQAIKSFYHLGEEVGKYMCASYGLEFTEKILQELQPAPRLFNLTIDFLAEMERRKSKHETLLLAYEVKALKELGYTPQLSQCVLCNSTEERGFFSIKDGGAVCKKCYPQLKKYTDDSLIYPVNSDILNILEYFLMNPLRSLEKLALNEEILQQIWPMIRHYAAYYLDLGTLKSERCLTQFCTGNQE